MFFAGALFNGGLDGIPRLAHRRGVFEVELHPADVGLVRDGLGVQLQHYRPANLLRQFHGLVFRLGNSCIHGGNAVDAQ